MGTIPLVMEASAEKLPWVRAILAKNTPASPRALGWGIGRRRNGRIWKLTPNNNKNTIKAVGNC